MEDGDNISGSENSFSQKAIKVLFPVISGLFMAFLLILIDILIESNNHQLKEGYMNFLLYYSSFIIFIAFLIQHFIVIPVFARYKFKSPREKFFGLLATVVFSVISSLVFAYLVSSPLQLPFEFLSNTLYAFILVVAYWAINLHVTDYLCKIKD
ncbi:hypothetical protein SDC9_55727 [bioreactor metagenome]|uniref:Uncharacterized protein n=1 Tax=bioreactor metagenome TaxID=1076179 RepID=A0A644WZS6_9ZZZZ